MRKYLRVYVAKCIKFAHFFHLMKGEFQGTEKKRFGEIYP